LHVTQQRTMTSKRENLKKKFFMVVGVLCKITKTNKKKNTRVLSLLRLKWHSIFYGFKYG
jgi:hypothetical protein